MFAITDINTFTHTRSGNSVQGKRVSIKSGSPVEIANRHASLTVPEAVITTNCGTTSDDVDATMETPGIR